MISVALPWSTTHEGYTRPLCSAYLKTLKVNVLKANEDPATAEAKGRPKDAFVKTGSEAVSFVDEGINVTLLRGELKKLFDKFKKAPGKPGVPSPLLQAILHPPDTCPNIQRLQTLAESVVASAHGLCLPGGDDIEPWLYGEDALPTTDKIVDHRRSILELHMLKIATRRGLPVLAICRGSQMVNVYWGGKLIQSVERQFVTDKSIEVELVWPEGAKIPPASILRGLTKGGELGKATFKAASFHHQAVDEAKIGGQGMAGGVRSRGGQYPKPHGHGPIVVTKAMLSKVNGKVFGVFVQACKARAAKQRVLAQIASQ